MWVMLLIMAMPVLGLILFELWPLSTALPIYIVLTAISLVFDVIMIRAMRRRARTGFEEMLGNHARVLSWQGSGGKVTCHGEIWSARSREPENWEKGQDALIEQVEGLVLVVRDPSSTGPAANGRDTANSRGEETP